MWVRSILIRSSELPALSGRARGAVGIAPAILGAFGAEAQIPRPDSDVLVGAGAPRPGLGPITQNNPWASLGPKAAFVRID